EHVRRIHVGAQSSPLARSAERWNDVNGEKPSEGTRPVVSTNLMRQSAALKSARSIIDVLCRGPRRSRPRAREAIPPSAKIPDEATSSFEDFAAASTIRRISIGYVDST